MPNDNPKLPPEMVDPVLREELTGRLFFNTAKPNEVDFQTLFKAFIHRKEDGIFLDENSNLLVGHDVRNAPNSNPSTDPRVRLDVNGAVKVGDTGDAAPPGTIKYTEEFGFQGKHGEAWISLGGSGEPPPPPPTTNFEILTREFREDVGGEVRDRRSFSPQPGRAIRFNNPVRGAYPFIYSFFIIDGATTDGTRLHGSICEIEFGDISIDETRVEFPLSITFFFPTPVSNPSLRVQVGIIGII